ncbi:hypothetical protein F441_00539 [Phytophthora nicotianae CJ01A1]|uniref:Uncharacterized protein n=4 Tax=Phytophthora nicotianae TaxID=4792 RepID=W2XY71_PHYNI|nr:hypothetical protein L914_00509 [Phytophthora nicotianae]ETO85871.1 hypothetical protein F444_00538 [Phytophthora nicotianae P1976]ETP26874.1 hypothetical protein F441_00539 [Phytophthora nicotianae CJ01A1]
MLAEEKAEEEIIYGTVNVQINGSQFRRVLELPNHNLLVSGVIASFFPPPELDEDVEDVDHMSE